MKTALLLVAALIGVVIAGGVLLPQDKDGDGLTTVADAEDSPPAPDQAAVSEEPPPPAPAPRRPLIVLDPGHGGPEVGAASNGVVEKDSNLDMAFRVEALLHDQGFDVLLSRRGDARATPDPSLPSVGGSATRGDLQARLDMANAAGAAVWVSLHSNGSSDRFQRGLEVWYDPNRPFGGDNLRLADLLLSSVLDELRAYGYPVLDRGLKDDTCFRFVRERCFTLFVLGGGRENQRAAQMPGALIESLFISNQEDNFLLRDNNGRDAIARGIAKAIVRFLGYEPGAG